MSDQKFVVQVTDHAHYMEEEGEYTRGEFAVREEAEVKCKEIIDRSLGELFSLGISAEDLFKQFMLYGEEASCEGFDSMEYIRLRCEELSNKK
jgi:hypothetical protein